MTVRRISGLQPRFTSTSVGLASWSTSRWSSAPSRTLSRCLGDTYLAADEKPASRVPGAHLLSVEQLRMLCDERLKLGFDREGRLFERFNLSVRRRHVDSLCHRAFLVPRCTAACAWIASIIVEAFAGIAQLSTLAVECA